MEAPSPARLYAAAVGALLLVVGVLGFFYGASFGGPGNVEPALGVLRVNGWLNLLHVATGALGLLVAGVDSRRYSLTMGWLYTGLAVWGWAVDGAFLGFLPAAGGDEALHLALGVLGLAAAVGTPEPARARRPLRRAPRKRRPPRRPSESRAKAAGEGA